MVEQPIYVKIVIWLSGLLPAIFGSLISLKLSSSTASFKSRLFSFFAGIIVAHYWGWGIIEHYNISPDSMVSSSILLAIGIFGVTAASEITKQFPEFIKGLFDRLLELISKK